MTGLVVTRSRDSIPQIGMEGRESLGASIAVNGVKRYIQKGFPCADLGSVYIFVPKTPVNFVKVGDLNAT